MLRVLVAASRLATNTIYSSTKIVPQNVVKSSLVSQINVSHFSCLVSPSSFLQPTCNKVVNTEVPNRNVIKFSYEKGKRQPVKEVLQSFYRLDWGIWIRTKCGRHKKLWKKSPPLKRRLRQHVFCNSTQSWLLDKMVGETYRKPKYFVDDPYEPYNSREEFPFTRTKPRPYFPPEENSSKN